MTAYGGMGRAEQEGLGKSVHVLLARAHRVPLAEQVAQVASGNSGLELGFADVRDALVVAGVLKDVGVSHVLLEGDDVTTLGTWLELLGFAVSRND